MESAAEDGRDNVGDQPSRQTIQAETAGHLRTLYTIGAGISGAVAMDRIVTYGDDFIQPELVATAVIMLVAFVATIVPFFHGAMRHMHSAWDKVLPSPGLMMYDFVFLFSQTLIFVLIASLSQSPLWFTLALALLLAVDVAWLTARRAWGELGDTGWIWARVNVPFIVLLLGTAHLLRDGTVSELGAAFVIAALAVIRTIVDYYFSREFYFGTESAAA